MNTLVDVTTLPAVKKIIDQAKQKIFILTGVDVSVEINTGTPNTWVKKRARLKQAICNYFEVSWTEIESGTRKPQALNARHTYIYLARTIFEDGYSSIGREFGNPNHTTILSAFKKVKGYYDVKDQFTEDIEACKKLYYATEGI